MCSNSQSDAGAVSAPHAARAPPDAAQDPARLAADHQLQALATALINFGSALSPRALAELAMSQMPVSTRGDIHFADGSAADPLQSSDHIILTPLSLNSIDTPAHKTIV